MNPLTSEFRMMAATLERQAHEQELLAGDLRLQARKLRQLAASKVEVPALVPVSDKTNYFANIALNATSYALGEPVETMRSNSRVLRTTTARHIAMAVLHRLVQMPEAEIGTLLRRTRHAVTYALDTVKQRELSDRHFKNKLALALNEAKGALIEDDRGWKEPV